MTSTNPTPAATPLMYRATPRHKPAGCWEVESELGHPVCVVDDRETAELFAAALNVRSGYSLAATPLVQEAEPVAFRTRYRSEPGMIGHYPWSYTDKIRGRRDLLDKYEFEALYVRATGVQATEVAPPKTLDDPRLQELFTSCIDGALTSGYQGTSPPPEGHWLAFWWKKGQAVAMVEEGAKRATEVASPVVGAASDDDALERLHALLTRWNLSKFDNRVADVAAERSQVLSACAALATPSQQEDHQPVAAVFRQGDAASLRWLIGAIPPAHDTLLYTRAAPPARSSVPLTEAQVNHLRRLLGWASCEVGQSPGEMVQGVRELAAKGLETDEAGKARLLQAHQTASNVPKYIRAAIKALGPVVVSPQSPQEPSTTNPCGRSISECPQPACRTIGRCAVYGQSPQEREG